MDRMVIHFGEGLEQSKHNLFSFFRDWRDTRFSKGTLLLGVTTREPWSGTSSNVLPHVSKTSSAYPALSGFMVYLFLPSFLWLLFFEIPLFILLQPSQSKFLCETQRKCDRNLATVLMLWCCVYR